MHGEEYLDTICSLVARVLLEIAVWGNLADSASMLLDRFPEIRKLSRDEKQALVSELWTEIEEGPEQIDPAVVAELDRRMAEFREHPDRFTTWEAPKAGFR